MQSIDRKLARLAREIESAKPKGLNVEDFETLHHPFPDGTFDGGGKAVHTFNVGDKVRHKNYPSDDFGVVLEVAGDLVSFVGESGHFCYFADRLELVPEEKPATPDLGADGEGWVEWSGGPVPEFHERCETRMVVSGARVLSPYSWHSSFWTWEYAGDGYRIVAYRLVK